MNSNFDCLADKIFADFEDTHNTGICKGYLSLNTNTLLAFETYIETLSVNEIRSFDSSFDEQDLMDFRRFIQNGIEKYLLDNIKTIAIM